MIVSRRAIVLLILLLFAAACSGGSGGSSDSASSGGSGLNIGAHYYVWFPQNFNDGYLRQKLSPSQEPFLGEYDSSNPATGEQQISLASQYGINFFTLDWWPTRPRQNSAIDDGFLKAANLNQIHFCIFYETIDLGFNESTLTTTIDDAARNTFVSNMVEIANRYFSNPQYLRINNRPVVFFYVTRTLSGQFAEMFQTARAALQEQGINPFFVGDEIYWINTIDTADGPSIEAEPNTERARLFDAITAYNLYAPSFAAHAGYASSSSHLADAEQLYRTYRNAVPDVPIIPDVIPGYNDRGHRLELDHYAIPRQFSPGESAGSLLEQYFQRIGVPFADPNLQMAVVTSWNEWNEDTAIEPIVPAAETTHDASGTDYTQGYAYGGTGLEALEVVKEFSNVK